MKLTKAQREEGIETIIRHDMEGLYKERDIYHAFYEGILPYKDIEDEEIIEWYQENEHELPKESEEV